MINNVFIIKIINFNSEKIYLKTLIKNKMRG